MIYQSSLVLFKFYEFILPCYKKLTIKTLYIYITLPKVI